MQDMYMYIKIFIHIQIYFIHADVYQGNDDFLSKRVHTKVVPNN